MKQTILIFGGLAAAIFILFELNKLSILGYPDSSEGFIVFSGVLFIIIGFLIHRFFTTSNSKVRKLGKSSLSKQEHKVLLLMSDGLSNNEIADKLFISESTVKTHVSHILNKLKAKRRTEAIKIGRDLDLV